MKFTRSFPANASARANVPERIVRRRMLMRKSWRNASSTEHATQQRNIASSRLRSIHSTKGVPSMTNLRALKSAK